MRNANKEEAKDLRHEKVRQGDAQNHQYLLFKIVTFAQYRFNLHFIAYYKLLQARTIHSALVRK